MRNSILILLFCSLLTGCNSVPAEALYQPRDNALISDAFVLLMEQGKTTRKQEQAFILANRRAWHAQNFALNNIALPADLQPGSSSTSLTSILMKDSKVLDKLQDVERMIKPN